MAEEGVPPVEYTALKPGVIRDQREGGQKVGQLKKGEQIRDVSERGHPALTFFQTPIQN